MVEVKNESGQARISRLTFPHACDTIAGEVANEGVDQIVGDVEGELAPRHKSEGRACYENISRTLSRIFFWIGLFSNWMVSASLVRSSFCSRDNFAGTATSTVT